MPIFNGSQRIKELYVGGQRIKSAHMWNGTAWQRVHIWPVASPSRVNKSGDQILPTTSSYYTATGWTLAPGYQGQATTNGQLVVGAGTVNIAAQVRAQISGGNKYLRIMKNGVQVGPEGEVGSSTLIVSTSANSISVDDGDVISVSVRLLGTLDASRTIVGGSESFIQITAA